MTHDHDSYGMTHTLTNRSTSSLVAGVAETF